MTLATFSQAGSEEVGNGAETVKVKISQDVLIYSSINPKYNITLFKINQFFTGECFEL